MSQIDLFADLAADQVESKEAEFYPTPAWCVRVLLDNVSLPSSGGWWCDPAAGEGHLIRAVEAAMPSVRRQWTGYEIRKKAAEQCRVNVADFGDRVTIYNRDYFAQNRPFHAANIFIINPPFSRALEFAKRCLDEIAESDGFVCMLVRQAFTETPERSDFLRAHPCDLLVLDKRPRFSGEGTDMWAYAWCVWGPGQRGRWKPVKCP